MKGKEGKEIPATRAGEKGKVIRKRKRNHILNYVKFD